MRKRTLKTIIFGLIAFCVVSAATASETPIVEGEGVALVIKASKLSKRVKSKKRGEAYNAGSNSILAHKCVLANSPSRF